MSQFITFLEYVKIKSLDKKKLDKIGDCRIYTVNASSVRDSSIPNNEFADFGTHMDFPRIIPNNEIWIAKDMAERERQFAIHNGVTQYRMKAAGKRNYYAIALKHEKAEREKVDKLKFHPEREDKKPPKKVYHDYYCGIPSPDDDVEVWLVDGEKVRDTFKTDFAMGGNGLVYSWVPKQEIWIEKNLPEKERDLTILHEYVESTLMKLKKLSYDKAHTIASKVEWHHRKNWDIEKVKDLSREEAIEMAKKYL